MNIFGTLGYAEEEFWASLFKLSVVIVFIIIGIVLNCGGGSGEYSTYVGGRYWREPGALANGFKGICSVFGEPSDTYGASKTSIPTCRYKFADAVRSCHPQSRRRSRSPARSSVKPFRTLFACW